jgi:hypothetical protein
MTMRYAHRTPGAGADEIRALEASPNLRHSPIHRVTEFTNNLPLSRAAP